MNAHVWTPPEVSRMRLLWRAGAYDGEIARDLDLTIWTVRAHRVRMGMAPNPYRGHPAAVRARIGLANHAKWAKPAIAAAMLSGLAKGRRARWQ